jgi:hypothetical protein
LSIVVGALLNAPTCSTKREFDEHDMTRRIHVKSILDHSSSPNKAKVKSKKAKVKSKKAKERKKEKNGLRATKFIYGMK